MKNNFKPDIRCIYKYPNVVTKIISLRYKTFFYTLRIQTKLI